ncbi:conserved Plasmodium protein, unknown function [Plasmodium gallinaceum]|uniref:Uncharacterized protein n=1 Tax=Plasmodium gallinaceum TaxID=5849 RepID=A0A1J1GSP3_PLAGA|nr:conserved Plasmodium protein, unknown function [Plasmodium gallinaceum]CRG95549.1 conserved Plasmodium protein, unknown function [Plasmodium gallinaceum]
MKNNYIICFKLIKVKNFFVKQNNFKTYSDFIERKKKINYISYSPPIEKENDKYNFEILMKAIKNRANEYNLIKIKEVQDKILIHLKHFNINEVISTLIFSFKYNLLNSKILFEIIECIFQNSCFLNTKHLYVLMLIRKQLNFENMDYFYNEKNERINKTNDFIKHINENFFWKKKYFREVEENIFSSIEKEVYSKEKCVHEIDNNTKNKCCDYDNVEINEKSIVEKEIYENELYEYELNENNEIFPSKKLVLNEKDISFEMEKAYLKIKNILYHNYNNIYVNIKNNMYICLLLLNYLYDENIIKKDEFLKIVYNINVEFNLDTFQKNKSDKNSSYSHTIINLYIQEQNKNESIYDIYMLTHLNLLKNIFKKSNYISDENVFEKIENDFSIDEGAYIHKKLYLDTFRMFFNNCLYIKDNINYLKLFYLNVITHEIFKLFNDYKVHQNIKINYMILKNIKCVNILKEENDLNNIYYFLSILYYFKKNSLLNYKMNLFDDNLSDIKKIHNKYMLFLNLLNNYNLYELLIDNNIVEDEINNKYLNKEKRENKKFDDKIQNKNVDELKNNFFCYFMVEFTFNITHLLNKTDIYMKLHILKCIRLLNFKNEYLIDIINEHLFNFFINKSFYMNNNYFLNFLEYLLISIIYSPSIFFYLLKYIDKNKFKNLLDSVKQKKKFINKLKKIYDNINIIINENEKWTENVVKNNLFIKYNTKEVKSFQNMLYDFLFL